MDTGAMKPEGMITKTIKLDQVAEEGFKTLIEDKENHVKILVDVGAGI
jgi:threonine dehydrogenase-like Zn-dependent dehydrogenase